VAGVWLGVTLLPYSGAKARLLGGLLGHERYAAFAAGQVLTAVARFAAGVVTALLDPVGGRRDGRRSRSAPSPPRPGCGGCPARPAGACRAGPGTCSPTWPGPARRSPA
jgi:hypothetical protein